MVYLIKKKISGKIYLYLVHKARINGKVKTIFQKYLGPELDFIKLGENIDISTTDYSPKVHDFGLPVALMKIAERLNFINIVNQHTTKRSQGLSVGEYLLISTINRCIKPSSKAQIKKWFDLTYLKSIFPKIETYLDSNAYTNHFEYLDDENIELIEEDIHKILLSKFGVNMDNLYYDPTNFYTFINPGKQELPRHGKSKEGRYILNIVNLSLFCVGDEGIPVMHKTYAGNIQDATHFKTEFPRFTKRMEELNLDKSKLTLIFDKGNLSEEGFQDIEGAKVKFICSIRPSTQKELHHLKGEEFEIFTLPNGSKVGLKEFKRELYGKRYTLIVTYDPSRNTWSRNIKTSKIEKKIDKVQKFFENRLNTHKWKNKENVENKIRNIIAKKEYFDYIDYNVQGEFENVTFTINLKPKYLESHLDTLGKSYYMTNRYDLSPKEIIWLYRQQYTVEHAFKHIKSTNYLQIRPIHHSKDSSIRGHVFSTILGLLLLTLLHKEVRLKFPEMSLMKMIESLSEIQTVSVVNRKGETVHTFAEMSEDAKILSLYLELEKYF